MPPKGTKVAFGNPGPANQRALPLWNPFGQAQALSPNSPYFASFFIIKFIFLTYVMYQFPVSAGYVWSIGTKLGCPEFEASQDFLVHIADAIWHRNFDARRFVQNKMASLPIPPLIPSTVSHAVYRGS